MKSIHFPVIDSTNSWAKANVHLWDQHGITLVTADSQSAGRGRQGRNWASPALQNIYGSYCFFVSEEQPYLFNVGQIMGLSVVTVLEKKGFHPRIKWPNDITLSGKKLGGILCETVPWEGRIGVVVGIGLNVNMPAELLRKIDQPATSLLAEGKQVVGIKQLIDELSKKYERDLRLLLAEGFAPFVHSFTARLRHKKNEPLLVEGEAGAFHSLNEDGSLNLLLPDGKIKKLYSGEIFTKPNE